MWQKFKNWLKKIYDELMGINDSPFRKAAGLGLGIFLGIFPGTGPMAAFVMSWLLKVNRAAALLGSLLTNSWLSLVTFFVAIKVGAVLTGLNWHVLEKECRLIIYDFHFKYLFDVPIFKIIWPLLVGYVFVGAILGGVVFLVTWGILLLRDKGKQ